MDNIQEQNIPIRSLHRWVNQYRNNGLKGLEQKARGDKGQYRLNFFQLLGYNIYNYLKIEKKTYETIYRSRKTNTFAFNLRLFFGEFLRLFYS